MPQTSRRVLDEALTSSGVGSFGVLGSLIVLISATNLTRALARAYGAIWALPRLRNSPAASWRWLVAVEHSEDSPDHLTPSSPPQVRPCIRSTAGEYRRT
jgi:hypothetical protein